MFRATAVDRDKGKDPPGVRENLGRGIGQLFLQQLPVAPVMGDIHGQGHDSVIMLQLLHESVGYLPDSRQQGKPNERDGVHHVGFSRVLILLSHRIADPSQ